MNSTKVELLKRCINSLRDLRKETIKSDTMTEEQLYYLQEGCREGLCNAAMMLADELDALTIDDPQDYMEAEEEWWHSHDEHDIGTEERL